MTRYKLTDRKPSSSEAFAEASATELKVLVALMECGGAANDEQLLKVTGASQSRLAAALTLWQGEGIIEKSDTVCDQNAKTPYGNTVADEFEERVFKGEISEQTAKETADTIRNNNLASVIDECAKLMGKINLTPMEVKRVSSLSSQYGFSEEYIAMLMYHLSEKSVLTVNRLINKAIKLADDNINTVEDLERYLFETENERGDFAEIKKILKRGRDPLAPTEIKLFRTWLYDFGFGIPVISYAYDRTIVNTGSLNYPYMDALLSNWHKANCKTVDDCKKNGIEFSNKWKETATNEAKAEKKGYSKPERIKPEYNFDPEEALRRAVARSFSLEDKGEEN